MTVTLETAAGNDAVTSRFGFRSAEYTIDGFKLNGRVVKLRGLNRHQAWPHLGYAMGRRGQEKDADILKFDLPATSPAPRIIRSRNTSSIAATRSACWSSKKSPAGSISAVMPGRRRAFRTSAA